MNTTKVLELLFQVCGLGGLGLIWLGPMILVGSLAERRGMRYGWLEFLTFIIPISALVSIPLLLVKTPNMESVRKYAERKKRSMAKARKEDPKKVQITEEDTANMVSLKPWIKILVIYAVFVVLWLCGFIYICQQIHVDLQPIGAQIRFRHLCGRAAQHRLQSDPSTGSGQAAALPLAQACLVSTSSTQVPEMARKCE